MCLTIPRNELHNTGLACLPYHAMLALPQRNDQLGTSTITVQCDPVHGRSMPFAALMNDFNP
jgi:hypothetical protein